MCRQIRPNIPAYINMNAIVFGRHNVIDSMPITRKIDIIKNFNVL